MVCTSCAFENPKGVKYCGKCGNHLPKVCISCEFENPAGFKFCGNCGLQFEEDTTVTPKTSRQIEAQKGTDAERRHLTVMFCDIVGSTALSNQLDPEDLRGIITEYQSKCQVVVAQFEGHIAQYLGDGLLVYFGYPVAHENDADRAVSSGLGIINAMQQLNLNLEKTHGINLSIRIGVHTGHVVVGDIGSSVESKKLALGATPNIAARLEGIAESDTMVISSNTHNLVRRFFICQNLGERLLKGISSPVTVYRVVREKTAKIRSGLDRPKDQLPLVGRSQEIKDLLNYWKLAKQGNSRIVMLSAEAGMGKSRVLEDFTTRISDEPDLWLMAHRCSPYHRQTAYYPFSHAIKYVGLKFTENEDPAGKLGKLEGLFTTHSISLEEMVPLFAGIMGIPLEDSQYEPSAFSIEQQKRKITDTLISIILNHANRNNLLLVFEDLHWMDSSSLEVINQLFKLSPDKSMLTIVSFRPDFEPRWKSQRHLIPMNLQSLEDDAVKTIIKKIASNKKVPEGLLDQIIKKTDGIPLFVEELTKMVLSSEMVVEREDAFELSGPISSLAIPSTLHDSLIARLDRLSRGKILAQIGAVIGRDFDYSMIKAASEQDESQLRENLERLVQAELLQQSGVPPKATYTFRHALIRDAAYQSLVKSNQQRWHKQIGAILEDNYPEIIANHPEMVAYHLEKGLLLDGAIAYWIRAGEVHGKRQAYDESMAYLNRAMGLISQVTSEADSDAMKLQVLALQAPIYLMTAGWGSRLTLEASEKLETLARKLEDKLNLFRALHISTTCELFSGVASRALEIGKKSLTIAKELDRPDFIAEAYRIIGQIMLFTGDLVESRTSFAEAISIGQSPKWRGAGFDASSSILISQVQKSHAMWLLGYPDQALEGAKLAVDQANKRKHPYDKSICLFVSSFIHYWAGDLEQCRQHAQECKKVSEEYGNNMFAHESITYIGATMVLDGKVEEGLQMIINSISKREQRAKRGINLHGTCFAELCCKTGEFERGLQTINDLLGQLNESSEHHFRSELFRLRGDLLQELDPRAHSHEIAKCYRTSLEIARAQKAKSLELRTAISLAKWQRSHGKVTEGLDLIRGIYSWFKEGFQTKDLVEAKKLIDELNVESLTKQST